MLCSQRFHACWAPASASHSACRSGRLRVVPLKASSESSSEFQGVGGDKDVQEALLQQLRVQVDTQTLKDEIREDLKGKVENIKQIGEDVSVPLSLAAGRLHVAERENAHLTHSILVRLCGAVDQPA
eukprot:GHUV01037802.1.p1 GENE.GHUV01037802.1~~GHUV01037802.1.p1  ORF type:complete len:127 (-),score=11.56 GHUV01037802.1:540-920(-)